MIIGAIETSKIHWLQYKAVLSSMVNYPATITKPIDTGKLVSLISLERPISGFDKRRTLEALGYTETPYNPSIPLKIGIHGYSSKGKVSITRATQYPTATLWHELGHLLCEHEARGSASDPVFRPIAECEAELVAYLCAYAYDYNESKATMRGYIQSWSKDKPECLKQLDFGRIYTAVDRIREANNG